MIPAPFMDRNDTVRALEAAMVLAVIAWTNDDRARAAWQMEMVRDAVIDSINETRHNPPEDFA